MIVWVSAGVADWLTATVVPWWATVLLPILTLIVSQCFSNAAAEKQRKAETTDRDLERTHNLSLTETQLQAERTRASEERSDAAERARKAHIVEVFSSALDAIALLRADLARSATEEPLLEERDGVMVQVAEIEQRPLDAAAVTAFIASVGKVRLYVGDELGVDDVATSVLEYLMGWPNMFPDSRPAEASSLDASLRDLAIGISEIYRVRAGLT